MHLLVSILLQNTSVSPDGKLVAVLGDSADCLLADAQTGKVSYNKKISVNHDMLLNICVNCY